MPTMAVIRNSFMGSCVVYVISFQCVYLCNFTSLFDTLKSPDLSYELPELIPYYFQPFKRVGIAPYFQKIV